MGDSQDRIVDEAFRAKVIDEMIDNQENLDRRTANLRKHEIYRDKNAKWVIAALHHEEFDPAVRCQMENRVSDISICRKIINKLAVTYNTGVVRTVEDQNSQESINALEGEMDINTAMKKVDRYRQLFSNAMLHPVPVKNTRQSNLSGTPKYDLKLKVLSPWEYDVIEDPNDLTKPQVVILSDFPERFRSQGASDRGAAGKRPFPGAILTEGDRIDQAIADSPSDKGVDDDKREFIWWSDNWHFTTNSQGLIINVPFPEKTGVDQIRNPIGYLPFTNVTRDQDCHFWAQGGDDVPDISILINKIMTDINFITYLQGWGQLVISGKDIPNKLTGGPGKAFVFQQKDGDPTPQVFYATSNPPIAAWLETAKAQLAMLLSTNNLSVRQIATNLDVSTAASGIALMIENSELLGNTEDLQQLYRDKEPEMWEIIRRWHEFYWDRKALTEDFQSINKFVDSDVKLHWPRMRTPITEREKLEEIKLRKELKISTPIELLQKDDPDLTDSEAEEKLKELEAIKEENVAKFGMPPVPTPKDEEEEVEKETDVEEETD